MPILWFFGRFDEKSTKIVVLLVAFVDLCVDLQANPNMSCGQLKSFQFGWCIENFYPAPGPTCKPRTHLPVPAAKSSAHRDCICIVLMDCLNAELTESANRKLTETHC